MGISRITALEIQGNEVLCEAHGPDSKGKYKGWIYMLRGGEIHKSILNSNACYNSPEAAVEGMENVVELIRKEPTP
ncbi:hypothetical protein LCGC14_0729430 [marine sediment metagenome]|uniref:DUF1508 domain-containing protein n=1 Tax=marine sediment metagenome TaxID=412755 RepID=A0A0F9SV81_9ZZZZ